MLITVQIELSSANAKRLEAYLDDHGYEYEDVAEGVQSFLEHKLLDEANLNCFTLQSDMNPEGRIE